jgi:hypothetical protein
MDADVIPAHQSPLVVDGVQLVLSAGGLPDNVVDQVQL